MSYFLMLSEYQKKMKKKGKFIYTDFYDFNDEIGFYEKNSNHSSE